MSPTRAITLLLTLLLAACLFGPAATASPAAAHGKHARSALGQGIGIEAAHAVTPRRGKQGQRRRAARRRAARLRAARRRASAAGEATRRNEPGVLFRGDFDSGFDEWHVQSLSYRASLASGAFQGSQAARFEVHSGDAEPETGSQRSEVSGPTFDQGQDLYIRDAIRIPSSNSYDVPWQIIQQLHEEDWSGSPGMAVLLGNSRRLTLGAGDSSQTYWQSAPLQNDRWYDLIYRVYLSQDPTSGFVEVWLDGVRQTLADGSTRAYGQTIQAAQTYLKAGIYRSRSSDGTSVVEHDAIVVGDSYAAANS